MGQNNEQNLVNHFIQDIQEHKHLCHLMVLIHLSTKALHFNYLILFVILAKILIFTFRVKQINLLFINRLHFHLFLLNLMQFVQKQYFIVLNAMLLLHAFFPLQPLVFFIPLIVLIQFWAIQLKHLQSLALRLFILLSDLFFFHAYLQFYV